MSYKLFLDDYRDPVDCVLYMHTRIGARNPVYLDKDWVVVRSYDEFVKTIKERGLPYLVSFDHDLGEAHYGFSSPREWKDFSEEELRVEDGYDCAVFLYEYCYWHKQKMPEFFVHSMNEPGTKRILDLLNTHL